MQELLEQIKLNPKESFFIGIFQDHIDQSSWHYHQEFELSFITEGSGSRIVGDSVEEFHPGDLIFIGQRIPHVWFSKAPVLNQHSGRTLESVYLLFNQAISENPGAIVGLSALLTTTMANMEGIVTKIKEVHPGTKVLVGGAPLNDDFRSKIGADFYSPDPRGAVEYLKELAV